MTGRGWLAFGAFTLLVVLGCGDPACEDGDGDGARDGCQPGPDADPDSAPDCDEDPEAEGCPCVGFRRVCRLGPASTDGVGQCQTGFRYCRSRAWTACEDAEGPRFERCNDLDDDCDGRVDERVTSPCGGCDDDCQGGVWGEFEAPFVGESPLAIKGDGALSLATRPRATPALWVANTAGQTVSRVDPQRAVEVARYALGYHPTHVAVDARGDAWIAGRDDGGSAGALFHIAADPTRCHGQAGPATGSASEDSGTPSTSSTSSTSSGPDDIRPVGTDDCVREVLVLPDGPASALAVDGARGGADGDAGFPWLGYPDRVERRHPDGGDVVATVATPALAPHTATFAPNGTLFLVDRAGFLGAVAVGSGGAGPAMADTPEYQLTEVPAACFTLDSVASDRDGNLLLSTFACESVLHYEAARDRWSEVAAPGVLSTRGVALAGESFWVAHTAGEISRLGGSPLAFQGTYSLARMGVTPVDTHALAADADGQLWAISRIGGPEGRGLVTRFDPQARQVTAQVPVGLGPRALGDFSGMSFGFTYEPRGKERHTFVGCSVEAQAGGDPILVTTRWQRLHVSYQAGTGGRIEVRARHAPEASELAEQPWGASFSLPEQASPFELPFPAGGVVEVEVTLYADQDLGAPRLSRVGLEWRCPAPT